MSRTTQAEVYALVRQLGHVMGYVPAPAELGLAPGTYFRPTDEADGMSHEDERVHGYALMPDHISCYGGWSLIEAEVVTTSTGHIVPSGHYPIYDVRMGAGEFARALRLARNVCERMARHGMSAQS